MLDRQTSREAITSPLPIHLGAFLKMLRDRHAISQAQVLKHLPGWKQASYSKVEKDTRAPTFDQLVPIYAALAQAGVHLTLQDRRQFVLLARKKIEAMKTRHEHKSEADWQELRFHLAAIDHLPADRQGHTDAWDAHRARPRFAETRHLVGREEWLAALMVRLQGHPPKKLLILQGPAGVGKSSELHRLARQFLPLSRYTVVLCDLPPIERNVGPEGALDMLFGEISAEIGPSDAALLPASLETRIAFVLSSLERASKPVLLFLDHAENVLDERGLAWCWDRFLTKFLQWQHQGTLVLATKEWGGWFADDRAFVEVVTVPLLESEAGRELLERSGLQEVPADLLQALYAAIGGVPQSLKWVASLLQNPMVFDSWEVFDPDDEEADIASEPSPQTLVQRIERLLADPSIINGPAATRLKPLLDRVLEKRLSSDAQQVLYQLAVTNIALGKYAVRALCPRPSLLQELKSASLLVASDHRVQILPLVAAALRTRLSAEQKRDLEERLAGVLLDWLSTSQALALYEIGMLVTELAEISLKHHRLLDAAQFLIRHGWLSFKRGHARRLAHLALLYIEEVRQQSGEQLDIPQQCGHLLLFNYLAPFLGHKIDATERINGYRFVWNAVSAGIITLQSPTEVAVAHHLTHAFIQQLRFGEALDILEACSARLQSRLDANPDLAASLMEKSAWLYGRWGEYAEEMGDQAQADRLQEQAIILNQQIVALLSQAAARSSLEQAFFNKRLARALNNLGYHLNRIGDYELARAAMEQSIDLKEQGYVELDTLADAYGEQSQILARLGRFQEALAFDEKACGEVQRLAEAGFAFAQAELPTYQVTRGCLYLRLGRLDEAERLLREAEPQVQPERRMYHMFAQQALHEIEQWRASGSGGSHYQLDWRWVERYRRLAAFDSYWWWTATGPFNEEEQRQWNEGFTPELDEAAKERLGTLLAAARERELDAALTERREPRLHYPAIAIEQVRARITALGQLDSEIGQDEPNAIVRKLYHATIAEEIDFLRMIAATATGDTEHYWECSLRFTPPPTREEMEDALSRVRHYVVQGLLHPGVQEASQRMLQIFEQRGITLDVSYTEHEEHALRQILPLSTAPRRMISVQTAKRFLEAALREAGYAEWEIVIDPNASVPRIEQGLRHIFLPQNRISLQQIKNDLSHELAGHVARCIAGERSLLGLLGIHTAHSLEAEEGLATYYERLEAERSGQPYDETGAWFGTLAVGLASGVITAPQTFRSIFDIFEAFIYLYRLLRRPDQDEETARRFARRLALARCIRTFRGVPDLSCAGICYTKDALYLRGLRKIEQAVAKDQTILDRLAVGVVALEQLPDLAQLGIVSAPQPLRDLAQRPDLDAYILSFESEETETRESRSN